MLPDPPEIEALLAQARAGAPAAVDRLLCAHRASLRRIVALRLDPALASRLDASDVVQEVLLEASRRLQDYLKEPRMPFHLWLRALAHDQVIDAHRRHRKAQRRSLDREEPVKPPALSDCSSVELAARFIDPELTPASAAVRHEIERRLHAAIAALDDDHREIILMRIHEGLGNQEAAAVLDLSEPAAAMRYLRAVKRLRALLVPGGKGESSSDLDH